MNIFKLSNEEVINHIDGAIRQGAQRAYIADIIIGHITREHGYYLDDSTFMRLSGLIFKILNETNDFLVRKSCVEMLRRACLILTAKDDREEYLEINTTELGNTQHLTVVTEDELITSEWENEHDCAY
jgi:hypothetical protein